MLVSFVLVSVMPIILRIWKTKTLTVLYFSFFQRLNEEILFTLSVQRQ